MPKFRYENLDYALLHQGYLLKEYLIKYLGNNQQIEDSIDLLKKIYSLRILAAHKRSSTKIDKDQNALEKIYGKKFPDILNGIFIEINKLIKPNRASRKRVSQKNIKY